MTKGKRTRVGGVIVFGYYNRKKDGTKEYTLTVPYGHFTTNGKFIVDKDVNLKNCSWIIVEEDE
uniref:Uncharacterized protein n=1 Tax=viral metagenome TaxID=1070528 RepID=A0A6M3KSI0_9ZZZZ